MRNCINSWSLTRCIAYDKNWRLNSVCEMSTVWPVLKCLVFYLLVTGFVEAQQPHTHHRPPTFCLFIFCQFWSSILFQFLLLYSFFLWSQDVERHYKGAKISVLFSLLETCILTNKMSTFLKIGMVCRSSVKNIDKNIILFV